MEKSIKNIGELLQHHRKANGLTQEEVGARMGVQKAMISKIEKGHCHNLNTIEHFAEALNTEAVVKLRPRGKIDKAMIDYVMAAIAEFSRHFSLTISQASNYLIRFGGIEYLIDFYDVEHTLSFNDCVEDLAIVCAKNGGALK